MVLRILVRSNKSLPHADIERSDCCSDHMNSHFKSRFHANHGLICVPWDGIFLYVQCKFSNNIIQANTSTTTTTKPFSLKQDRPHQSWRVPHILGKPYPCNVQCREAMSNPDILAQMGWLIISNKPIHSQNYMLTLKSYQDSRGQIILK